MIFRSKAAKIMRISTTIASFTSFKPDLLLEIEKYDSCPFVFALHCWETSWYLLDFQTSL